MRRLFWAIVTTGFAPLRRLVRRRYDGPIFIFSSTVSGGSIIRQQPSADWKLLQLRRDVTTPTRGYNHLLHGWSGSRQSDRVRVHWNRRALPAVIPCSARHFNGDGPLAETMALGWQPGIVQIPQPVTSDACLCGHRSAAFMAAPMRCGDQLRRPGFLRRSDASPP